MKHFKFYQCPRFSRYYSLNLQMHYLISVAFLFSIIEVWFEGAGAAQMVYRTPIGWTIRGLNTGRRKKFSLLQNQSNWFWGLSSILFNLYCGSFPAIKQLWRELDHSPPSGAQVKNEWSYTPTTPILLQGTNRDNFTFKAGVKPLFSFALNSIKFNFGSNLSLFTQSRGLPRLQNNPLSRVAVKGTYKISSMKGKRVVPINRPFLNLKSSSVRLMLEFTK